MQVDRLYGQEKEFQNKLEELQNNNEDGSEERVPVPETQSQRLKSILQETTAELAGIATRKNRDWFDENDADIEVLLQKKRSCFERVLAKPDDHAAKADYRRACSTALAGLRDMQSKWWTNLAEETQHYADTGNTRAFYEALRAVYGPTYQVQAPLNSSDGNNLLTDKESILRHWAEHFGNLFADKRQVQEESIRRIPQHAERVELDEPPT
ncbi:hypothetical protein Pmani_000631 [Petrolisthes manimaculis]|uniref:Uncharacterized protein n=1 Tax=Petrolisthes manimaculis TaxID=1843537 RepID=A0AAE1QLQ0_9EUCA|nr:hypothetical protein Pmani_000631 [Petrolisthes manimaculis]